MHNTRTFVVLSAFFASYSLAQNLPVEGSAGVSQCTYGNGPTTCNLQTSQSTFVQAICVNDPQKPGEQNGECGYVAAACATDDQCQTNGSCLYPLGQTTGGQCRGYFGDPCGNFLGCLGFLSCGTAADVGTLFPACGGVGAACTRGVECASGLCTGNICAPRAPATRGEPCGIIANDNNYCGPTMTCDPTSSTCQRIVAPSQAAGRRQRAKRTTADAKFDAQTF